MTNQYKFILTFGSMAWQQALVDTGIAEQFKEYWAGPYLNHLKTCPFCGGEAKTFLRVDMARAVFAEVICERCRAKTNRFWDHEHGAEIVDRAIEAWNGRAENRTCD